MEDYGKGCIVVVIALLALAAVLAVLFLGPNLLGSFGQDRQAQRDMARAAVIEAQKDQEHQQSVDHMREVELYAVTLAAFLNGDGMMVLGLIFAALIGSGMAVAIVRIMAPPLQ